MNPRKEYIEKLLERFLKGQTSETEEQVLTDFFCEMSDVPEEWQVYQDIFTSFQTDAYDFSVQEIDAMLTPVPEKKTRIIPLWTWVSTAVAAAVVFILLMKPADPKVDLNELEELTASVTIPGEQVDSYNISMVGDGTVVTKTLSDGTTSSYLVLASTGDEEREIIPLAND